MITINTMKSKRTTNKGYLDVPYFYSKAEEVKRATDALPDWEGRPITLPKHVHLDQDWKDILQTVAISSHSSGEQAKDLHYAIELLIAHDIARAEFWKHYLSRADKVMPKRGREGVAVACFFKEIVIVEFAPVGHAAYFYQREIFEKQVMNRTWFRRALSGWKNKQHTHPIPGVTNADGTFRHVGYWQKKLAWFLDTLIGE